MSAFIVNDKTLNRILTFLNHWRFYENDKLKMKFWGLVKQEKDETQEQVLNSIGLMIKELNAEAVNQRYEEDNGKQEFFYSPSDCGIFQAYNHIRCLTYQMLEGNVPKKKLYKILQEIENQIAFEIAGEHPQVKSAEWEAK
jgi:hypothetical protein